MIGGLVLSGILVFIFGLVLLCMGLQKEGSLTFWDGGPKLEGWLPALICIAGLIMIGFGIAD